MFLDLINIQHACLNFISMPDATTLMRFTGWRIDKFNFDWLSSMLGSVWWLEIA